MKYQEFNTDHTMGKEAEEQAALMIAHHDKKWIDFQLHTTQEQQQGGDFTIVYNDRTDVYDVKCGRTDTGYFYAEIWSNYGNKAGWLVNEDIDYIVQVYNDSNYLVKIDFRKLRESLGLKYHSSFQELMYVEANTKFKTSKQQNRFADGRKANTGMTINVPWPDMKPYVIEYMKYEKDKLVEKDYVSFICKS